MPGQISLRITRGFSAKRPEGLSVRDVEWLADQGDGKIDSDAKPGKAPSNQKTPIRWPWKDGITDAIELKIAITHQPNGKGRLLVDYKTLEQLDDLVDLLDGSSGIAGVSPRDREI